MSEEIIGFIKKHEPCSYTDLTSEFEETRGWSHGKFQNHFEKAKPSLEKRLVNGRPRYFIKKPPLKKLGFWERRAERKQLGRWEGRLRDLRGLRVYLRYRAESARGEFVQNCLDEVDKEIGMLEKLVESAIKGS